MTRKIKYALVDMDGTLYDSMPNHATAWKRLMDEIGVDARREEFFLYEGATGAHIIDMLIRRQFGRPATEAEKKDLYALKAKYFTEQPPVQLMPGARELIHDLRSRGIITVLVTGSGQNSLLSRLDEDFPGAFPPDRRVTSASVAHGKPAPDPYLKGLELVGASASEAIGIDNAPLGTRSSAAAGLLTVGVVTGPISPTDLIDADAHIVYNSMPECTKLLPRLLDKLENSTFASSS